MFRCGHHRGLFASCKTNKQSIGTVQKVYVVKQYHEKLVSFRFREDRLDHFLYEDLREKREFEGLWTLFKQLLTLFHGQASV